MVRFFLAPYMSHLCVQNKRIPFCHCLHKKLTFCQDQEKNSFCFCSIQALEIRGYLKSCGADINEESMSPLHEDLEQLLMACDINFKSEAGMCLKFLIISTYL